MSDVDERPTKQLVADSQPLSIDVIAIDIVGGPVAEGHWESAGERCAIGSHEANDVVIDDPAVSRFHCELHVTPDHILVRDLASRNGTLVDGVRINEAHCRDGSALRVGETTLRLQVAASAGMMPLSDKTTIGRLSGRSVAMRSVFATIERAAASDATVLLQGETGTGKDAAAETIHLLSQRADQPFVVIDCGAIPANLLESELFGHEKGSFTGANDRRIGAFESANGGTVFLDEIGEMPQSLQPKLLRVLDRREVRRIGANDKTPIDVRVIAATNRDLRAEVNRARFRSDLYFRLAVVRVDMPPLRERPEDIPMLVDTLAPRLGFDEETRKRVLTPELVASLQRAAWPGNVRELINHIERCLVMEDALAPSAHAHNHAQAAAPPVDLSVPYAQARREKIADFERRYLTALLQEHNGVVARAARASGIDRVFLHKLLKRHGLR